MCAPHPCNPVTDIPKAQKKAWMDTRVWGSTYALRVLAHL
ncbi:hypothetical protein L917_16926 [Phytophthora nicotianae]|uniref:Uncharacterized protein n=1 Tax=Phytophthora nicotianae TaxID=4792 RepID=W2G256_PHYNI|nr:hypothetical protein L915_17206 [Phytophthora nicotianae]ETL83046.1 hypothetical protein L917_16926 [Phytophthora nicotianae]